MFGELRMQNLFSNSQLQLNNDWFVSDKKASNFDAILKNQSVERSEVETGPKYKGLNNDTMDKHVTNDKVGNDREHFDQRRDLNELKASIREKIAQKRLQKETGNDGQVQSLEQKIKNLEKLKEKIEDLEMAIREELGLPEEMDALEMLASLMDISFEQLVLQLTSDVTEGFPTDQLVENLVDMLTSEEINTEMLVQELEQIVTTMPEEKLAEFKMVLENVMEQLPVESQELLQPVLDQVVEQLPESMPVETVAIPDLVTEAPKEISKEETAQPASENTEVKVEEDIKVEVKAKEEAPKQQMDTSSEEKEPMALTKKNSTQPSVNVEEQVNLMKNETSLIASAKVEPKGVVARSVMNQVIQGTKMSINLSDQGSEILIKLNPKNLGNVALKMAFDKGVLLAEIQVENQTVKGIIESNLDNLRSALKQEGYTIGNLDVSVNKENTGKEDQRGFARQIKKVAKHESFEDVEEIVTQQNLVNEKAVDYLA